MKTFSREKNVGWRIDYFFISKSLKDKVKKIKILGDQFGSDHAPVFLEIDL
jgi:exodeoxyribonuclease-3